VTRKQRRKKQKARRRRGAGTGPIGSKYFYGGVTNPLAGLSPADRDEFARLLGIQHAETFESDFTKLLARLREVEPLTVLGSFATYGLVSSGIELREWNEEHPILQHHVELLQGALLMVDTVAQPRPANPRDLNEIDELLRAVTQSFFLRRMRELADVDEDKRFGRFLIEDMRGQTQAVRNWGFEDQVRRIVTEVFEPLDPDIEKRRRVAGGIRAAEEEQTDEASPPQSDPEADSP
jgi:hypothetical protein